MSKTYFPFITMFIFSSDSYFKKIPFTVSLHDISVCVTAREGCDCKGGMCGIKLKHDLSMSIYFTIQYFQCVSFNLSFVTTHACDTNIQSKTTNQNQTCSEKSVDQNLYVSSFE